MIFGTFYRLNWAAPREPAQLLRDEQSYVRAENCQPRLLSGDVAVEYVGTQAEIAPVHVVSELARGNYLSLQTKLPRDAGGGAVLAAKARHAGLAASLELRWPGIVERCVWEAILQTPGVFHLATDGPRRFHAPIAASVADLQSGYVDARRATEALPPERRSRFELASRWYMRGVDADSPIDRFLFLFIALEVYPATDTTDVVRAVTELVNREVAPSLSSADVKERIGIGRIFGIRSDIVHFGLAVVDVTRSPDFDRRLQQLEAIAQVCMRVLAGMPPGTALDGFLKVASA
jgi:hypothetical protein